MPYYDFYCKTCKEEIEHFFKIADEKKIECEECGNQLKQIIVKAPGLRKSSTFNSIQRKNASISEIKEDKEQHDKYVSYAHKKVSDGEWTASKIHK